MYFGTHLTTHEERIKLMEEPGEKIMISPLNFHSNNTFKPIVWEEGNDIFYEHNIGAFLELLKIIDEGGHIRLEETAYYKRWGYKGAEISTRVGRLPALYKDIKENGIKEPVHCEATGERLDGSFRTKIAIHLGIKEVPAILHRFKWQDMTEEHIRRKLAGHWLSSGKEYYEFDYGFADLKNIPEGGEVYRENAKDRWEALAPLISGSVLDLGCNEGYMAIQCALAGHKTTGIDLSYTHGANLNKLVFEWVNKKDLPVDFHEEYIEVSKRTADTILLLNVIYHIKNRDEQVATLKRYRGKNVIIQCNLRKSGVREEYYGAHPEDAKKLLRLAGLSVLKEIPWRDKPIIIAS